MIFFRRIGRRPCRVRSGVRSGRTTRPDNGLDTDESGGVRIASMPGPGSWRGRTGRQVVSRTPRRTRPSQSAARRPGRAPESGRRGGGGRVRRLPGALQQRHRSPRRTHPAAPLNALGPTSRSRARRRRDHALPESRCAGSALKATASGRRARSDGDIGRTAGLALVCTPLTVRALYACSAGAFRDSGTKAAGAAQQLALELGAGSPCRKGPQRFFDHVQIAAVRQSVADVRE